MVKTPDRKQFFIIVISVILLGIVLFRVFESPMGLDKSSHRPELVGYVYSSFAADWGPGPALAKQFSERCNCDVKLIDVGEAGLILQRMKLMPPEEVIDFVVGIDNLMLGQALSTQEWRELNIDVHDVSQLEAFQDKQKKFFIFDWSPLAFVYRRDELKDIPQSLEDLTLPRFKGLIALQDPQTSTPGAQFLTWIVRVFGPDKAQEYFAKLKPNIHSVSPSWSSAYGLFKKRQAKLVFSYQTSPTYHLLEENDNSYAAAIFSEGHIIQAEYAGVPARCGQCALAEDFIRFMLEPESQKLIMKRNYMLSVNLNENFLAEFKLPTEQKYLFPPYPIDFKQMLTLWQSVFNKP